MGILFQSRKKKENQDKKMGEVRKRKIWREEWC